MEIKSRDKNNAQENEQYVTRLMKATCTMGTKDFSNYLNLPLDHGVLLHDSEYPLMNVNDHKPEEHIFTMGKCHSSRNKEGNFVQDMLLNMLIPGSLLIKKLLNCGGCPCKPKTISPWVNEKKQYFIEDGEAITIESKLNCYYGGVITIVVEKTKTADSEDVETVVEETPFDRLPQKMQDTIENFAASEDFQGEGMDEFLTMTAEEGMGSFATLSDSNQMAGITLEGIEENYNFNAMQSLPESAYGADGTILDYQSAADTYHYGSLYPEAMQQGCIAAYNAETLAGGSANLPQIIRFFQLLPLLCGILPGGGTGCSMLGMHQYFKAKGYQTKLTQGKKNVAKLAKTSNVSVMACDGIKHAGKKKKCSMAVVKKQSKDMLEVSINNKKHIVRDTEELFGDSMGSQVLLSIEKEET